MTRVRAPEGFERTVLSRLPEARQKRARARRATAYRFAFAGSAALLLVGFLVFAPASRRPETVLTTAERRALSAVPDRWAPPRVLPVYEAVDYTSEFRDVQSQPRTVYILEQVSESRSSEIIY
ncbi:MAG TPA: hypothetical protein PLP83_04760 [Candidatus Aminicenantes bacterium]|nr:hypothetical protein [Candidatus Aminicenantes bacterium]